jgi:hypothetical protein
LRDESPIPLIPSYDFLDVLASEDLRVAPPQLQALGVA